MQEQSAIVDHRIGVDEHAVAKSLGLSVNTIRKDRRNARRIPFYRIGKFVRYNLDSVRAALARQEEGGSPAPRGRRSASAL